MSTAGMLPRGRALAAVVLAFWTAIAAASVSQTVLDSVVFEYPFRWRPALIYVVRWYLWAAFVPLVAAVVVRLGRFRGRPTVFVAAHAASALVVSGIHFAAEVCLLSVLWTALIEPISPAHFLSKLIGLRVSVNVLVYVLIASAVAAYGLAQRHQAVLAEADRLRRDLDEARSAALAGGLVPHAMFNTLQALNGLVVSGRSDEASTLIARLGAWLRALLDRPPSPWSTVADERALAEQYLDVQRVRYGDRLRTEWHVEPSVRSNRVPAWLLQPLVENAVQHAVAVSERPVTVGVCVSTTSGVLLVEVRDDGPASSSQTAMADGVGLGLLRRRLEALYGPGSHLATSRPEEGGFVAAVTLPAR